MNSPRAGLVAMLMAASAPAAGCVSSAMEAHAAGSTTPSAETCLVPKGEWALWQGYKRHFIAEDGRVVDYQAAHSTSEGQAYGLFFALVARDHGAFARILRWTVDNLAGGDLGEHLPAWKWGERSAGKWGVIDPNPASDADLWLAYVLSHAAAVFGVPEYAATGRRLLALITQREVVAVEGIGAVLLPGPYGFKKDDGTIRLNHSYLPMQQLRWAARVDAGGPWAGVITSTVKLAQVKSLGRLYPDWVAYTPGGGFQADADTGAVGSYDAIRAYLWPAMLPKAEPHRGTLLAGGSRLLDAIRATGRVPEKVATVAGAGHVGPPGGGALNAGPVGFQAVGTLFARAFGDARLATKLATAVAAERQESGLYGVVPFYYDHNLILFVQGFSEGRYAFGLDGGLELSRDDGTCAGK